MNELIVGCYGDLTLKKLEIFVKSTRLHGRGDLKRIIASPCIIWISSPNKKTFRETKSPKAQTIRERLHNAHLAAGWDIWLRFGSSLTRTKRKNQQGFGLILLALCFLSPCRLEDECERRHSDLPTEPCPAPPQHILIVKWIARASWWLVPSACQVSDRARGPSQVSQWDYLFPAASWSVYFFHTFSHIVIVSVNSFFVVIAMTFNREARSCDKKLLFWNCINARMQCSNYDSLFSLSTYAPSSLPSTCLCLLMRFIAI